MAERKGSVLKCISLSIKIFSAFILISLFCYWSINAWLKYSSEPIVTHTEFRFGDDNEGNLSMPVISFCKLNSQKCCTPESYLSTNLTNATAFIESIKYSRPFEGNMIEFIIECNMIDQLHF